jgi:hypothetical protein
MGVVLDALWRRGDVGVDRLGDMRRVEGIVATAHGDERDEDEEVPHTAECAGDGAAKVKAKTQAIRWRQRGPCPVAQTTAP